jgi:hypothetical protein
MISRRPAAMASVVGTSTATPPACDVVSTEASAADNASAP